MCRVCPPVPRPAGPPWHLRGAREPGRTARLHGVRCGRRGRARPDREEAAVPRRSGLARVQHRDGGLPVPLPLLPELGDRPGTPARTRAPQPSDDAVRRSSAKPAARARHRSPTRTWSRRSSSSTPSTPAASRVRQAFATCSSPTATRRPRRSTCWPESSTRRTSTSRASMTRSTGGCAAGGSHTCSRRSWRCAGRGSGWSSPRSSSPATTTPTTELAALTRWIVETLGPTTPWHVSRFHPAHQMLDVGPTPGATLLRAAAIGRAAGLAHVYVGNAPELHLEHTRCAGCGCVVIERSGYRTLSHLTPGGRCRACNRPLEGLGLGSGARAGARAEVRA